MVMMKKRLLPALMGPAVMAAVFAMLALGCPQPGGTRYADADNVVILHNGNPAVQIEKMLENIDGQYTRQLSFRVEPPTAEQAVRWSVAHSPADGKSRRAARFLALSNDESPAGVTIDSNGLLTILDTATPGIWVVRAETARAPNGVRHDTLNVVVIPTPAEGIYIDYPDPAVIDVERGTPEDHPVDLEKRFEVRVEPAEALLYVSWEIHGIVPEPVNEDDIRLDSSGYLRIAADVAAQTRITVRITALAFDGVYADAVVNVIYREAAGIDLAPEGSPGEPVVLIRGQEREFNAVVTPPGARQGIGWSISPYPEPDYAEGMDGVTFTPDGSSRVTLQADASVAAGSRFVVRAAMDGLETAQAIVKVVAAQAESVDITVTPEPESENARVRLSHLDVDLPLQFDATVYPPTADQSVTWSVFHKTVENAAGVTRNAETGNLEVAPTATLGVWAVRATAAGGEIRDEVEVYVTVQPTGIYVSHAARDVQRGTPASVSLFDLFGVVVEPRDSGASQQVNWTYNSLPTGVSIDANGYLTVGPDVPNGKEIELTVAAGSFPEINRAVTVNVIYRTATGVTLVPASSPGSPIELIRGVTENRTLSATVLPPGARQAVEWVLPETVEGVTFDGIATQTLTMQAAATAPVRDFTVSARAAGNPAVSSAPVTVQVRYAPATDVHVTNAFILLDAPDLTFDHDGYHRRNMVWTVNPSPAASQAVVWSVEHGSAEPEHIIAGLGRRALRFFGVLGEETPAGVSVTADGVLVVREDATEGRWNIMATTTCGRAVSGSGFVQLDRTPYVIPTSIEVDRNSITVERGGSTPASLVAMFGARVAPDGAPDAIDWVITDAPDTVRLYGIGSLMIDPDAPVPATVTVRMWAPHFEEATARYLTINIRYRQATGVTLDPENPIELIRGEGSETLTATVSPPGARQAVEWVHPGVTGVGFDGEARTLTMQAAATAPVDNFTVSATAVCDGENPPSDQAIVRVVAAPAESVEVTPASAIVRRNHLAGDLPNLGRFVATVHPHPAADQSVTWSVVHETNDTASGVRRNLETGYLEVDDDATLGRWIVRATATGSEIAGHANVNLIVEPAGIHREHDERNMRRGAPPVDLASFFGVRVEPYALDAPQDITWSFVNTQPPGISLNDGLLTIGADVPAGTEINLRVQALDFPAVRADLIVNVICVTISPDSVSMVRGGDAQTFTVTVLPSGAQNAGVTWSIYPEGVDGVTFSGSGLTASLQVAATVAPRSFAVRAEVAGVAPVEATAGVIFAPPTAVIVTPNPVFLIRGGSQQFSARVEPYPAASQTVTWSRHRIGANLVTGFNINATGNVTIGNNTAQNSMWEVRATVAGVPAGVADVRVLQALPTGINVAPEAARYVQRGTPAPVNLTTLFNAQTTPGTAPNDLLAWEIVGNPVPGVELNNNLLTVDAGVPVPTVVNLRLSVSWFENIASVNVTVNIVYRDPVITVTPPSANVDRNSSQTFTAEIAEQPGGRPTNTIVWSSSPEVSGVTFNHSGHTATLAVGTTAEIGRTITVTAGLQENSAVTGSATATVTPAAPTSVTIDRAGLGNRELTRGQTLELTAVVVESWASIVWSVSPSGAGTFNPANGHTTEFTVADLATLGPITITARAVAGDVQDEVEMAIIIIECPACGEPDCGETFCGLVIRRGGPNPFGTRGAVNHIQLAYSFGGPRAANGVSYTMYFIEGEETDPVRIKADGYSRTVGQQSADAPGFITDVFFDFDLAYSAVIVRRQGQEEQTSNVILIPRVPNNILIVTNVPEASEVMVSALIGEASTTAPHTRAVGYRIPGVIPGMPATTRMFVFYELDGPCLGPANPESGQFDPTNPWTGEGSLFITLATHEAADEGRQYIQAINLGIPLPTRQNNLFRGTDRVTRQWSNFVFNPF